MGSTKIYIFLDHLCRHNQILFQWDPPINFVTTTDPTSEDGGHVPAGTEMQLLVGAESECGSRLAISEKWSIVLLNIDGTGRVEGHQLVMETVSLARESEALFYRAEVVQDNVRIHIEFGE